jgi:HAD superfamily hydrolase (TIGR01549 family)
MTEERSIATAMIEDRPVTAVIWDYDGTLVDTRAKNLGITRHIVHRFTGTEPDKIEGLRSLEAYTRALHRTHDWQQLYVDEFGMSAGDTHEAGRLWTEYQLADKTIAPVYDGVASALTDLESLPHGIVSMNSRANIERSLEGEGLLDKFELVIGYEEVSAARQKPAPDGLLMCLDHLTAMTPGHVVYVGDHQMDIECARNANETLSAEGIDIHVFAVGAAYGIGAEFGVWPSQPDYTVQKPEDVVGLIRR